MRPEDALVTVTYRHLFLVTSAMLGANGQYHQQQCIAVRVSLDDLLDSLSRGEPDS